MVSNFGRIRTKTGELLRGTKSEGNYITISITYDNVDGERVKKTKRLSRLVAIAFVPNPDKKLEVDHIDTNIFNNKADNLRWNTRTENMNNETTKKKFEKPVEQLDENGNIVNSFKSILEAKAYMKETYGTTGSGIGNVCNGKRGAKICDGFGWRFKKVE
ncbi:MAG: HNH endonuclease [Barrevirus sp.]|uniref:HNH endonuclease n=1 Tax=Barrevirus sp. TaxID=2487763 RepID=A0A3G4ZS75_9VIRU|nr:MAG: HNH endonuclease [Barrevirus sp.]